MKFKITNKIWFIIAAVLIVSALYPFINVSSPNIMQRESAGMLLSDFIKLNPIGVVLDGDIINIFSSYYNHYTIFTGFVEWPPLQIMMLGFLYLIFGLSNFVPYLFSMLFLIALCLVFIEFFKHYTDNKSIIYGSLILLLINPFVLFSILSTNIDFGQMFFVLIIYYFFVKYLFSKEPKYLYLTSLLFGIGCLYKFETLMIAVPLALTYLIVEKNNYHNLIKWDFIKKIILCTFIFILILSPYLLSQSFLMTKNLSPLFERTLGYATGEKTASHKIDMDWPILTPEDYEFTYEKDDPVRKAIAYRMGMPKLNRFIVTIASLSYQFLLAPFFLAFIYLMFKNKKHNRFRKNINISMIITIIFSIILYTLVHVLPRYLLIIMPFFIFMSVYGLFKISGKYFKLILVILIILSIIQTSMFFCKIEQGRHSTSFQHDFNEASKFVLSDMSLNKINESTIVLPWAKSFAHEFIKYDVERKVYLEYLPTNESELKDLLNNSFTINERLSDKSPEYLSLIEKPDVNYVLILETFEVSKNPKAPVEFNRKQFMDKRTNFELIKTISSTNKEDNSKIYIYRRVIS